MKTRNDFVSNSSSCSFVIQFNDDGASFDSNFLKILKQSAQSIVMTIESDNADEIADMAENAKAIYGKAVTVEEYEDNQYVLDFIAEKLNPDNSTEIDVFKMLLRYCTQFYVNCGEDFGSDLVRAVQTATVLELKYKDIEIQEDDHLEYETIRGTVLES